LNDRVHDAMAAGLPPGSTTSRFSREPRLGRISSLVLEPYFAEKGPMRTMNNRKFPKLDAIAIDSSYGWRSFSHRSIENADRARGRCAHSGARGNSTDAETVDTFKAGNPDTEVKGIAVTMMATLDVLQRRGSRRQNLIITHEPTFYNHQDKPVELEQHENDPVLAQSARSLRKHGLVIWRFHDHQHRMKADQIET